MCNHYVWRNGACNIQKCTQLAQRPGASLRKHPHSSVWKQSRYQRQKGQGKGHSVSQKEKLTGKYWWILVIDCIVETLHLFEGSAVRYRNFVSFSTMISVPRVTTTLRSRSCGWPENWLVIRISSLWPCLLCAHPRWKWIPNWQQIMKNKSRRVVRWAVLFIYTMHVVSKTNRNVRKSVFVWALFSTPASNTTQVKQHLWCTNTAGLTLFFSVCFQ